MAKKSKKDKKPSANPADALRDAVERTFAGAAGGASQRMSDVFDDFASALSRLRETLDERRVIETLETLRDEVAGLRQRVAELEAQGGSRASAAVTSAQEAVRNVAGTATRGAKKPAAAAKRAAKKTAAKRKPAARKAAAKRKPAARKSAAKKPAARKRAATKKPAAAKKPAATTKSASRSGTGKQAAAKKPAAKPAASSS
jgi:hypothetical protein